MKYQKNIIHVLKAFVIAVIVTVLFLGVLALVFWKAEISRNIMQAGILLIYILSAGLGGLYLGKKQREKKFLWGMLLGSLYFIVLLIITACSGDLSALAIRKIVTTAIICIMSGTLGGMLA